MTTPATGRPRETFAFRATAWLLVLAVLACGVFAGLAGGEIGNQNVDFAISYALLGVVVVLIFGLAWVDTTTKAGDRDFMQGHH